MMDRETFLAATTVVCCALLLWFAAESDSGRRQDAQALEDLRALLGSADV